MTAAALALPLRAVAESQIHSVSPEGRAELTALEEKWIDAEVHGDAETLVEILHENFLTTFASGTTLDRASYIDFIVGLELEPFKVRSESMVQYGDTVVVIDVSEDGTTKFTWIAIRLNGQWRVIAQTFSNMEASSAE